MEVYTAGMFCDNISEEIFFVIIVTGHTPFFTNLRIARKVFIFATRDLRQTFKRVILHKMQSLSQMLIVNLGEKMRFCIPVGSHDTVMTRSTEKVNWPVELIRSCTSTILMRCAGKQAWSWRARVRDRSRDV